MPKENTICEKCDRLMNTEANFLKRKRDGKIGIVGYKYYYSKICNECTKEARKKYRIERYKKILGF